MSKREAVMLAHTLDYEKFNKYSIAGWFVSHKLDGIRCFYDGGLTVGMPLKEIPFANTGKDDRLINGDRMVSTGLWSRNFKSIQAPKFFVEAMPKGLILDGEIFAGNQQWERTSSTIKKLDPDITEWQKIKFCAFDSPPLDAIFEPGIIETEILYKDFSDGLILKWAIQEAKRKCINIGLENQSFEFVNNWLKKELNNNHHCNLLEQFQLPYASSDELQKIINQRMEDVIKIGGEGLMLRKPESKWRPERSHNLLKIKKWYDDEATVLAYIWGRQTTKGSKLIGKMGAMLVEWNDKQFEISGFDWSERNICFPTGNNAEAIGKMNPGQLVQEGLINPKFPIGSKISFRYRELTASGLPKNANYYRKFNNL